MLGPDGRVRRIFVTNRDRTMIVNGLSIAFNMVDVLYMAGMYLDLLLCYSLTVYIISI